MSEEFYRNDNIGENGSDEVISGTTGSAGEENVFEASNVEAASGEITETEAQSGPAAPQADENGWVWFGGSANGSEAGNGGEAPETEAQSEPAAPQADENGWVWFSGSAAENAETAQDAPEEEKEDASSEQAQPAAEPVFEKKETTQPGEPVRTEEKREKSRGRGTKAYMVAMTAAFLAVAVMLGFCIFRLNGIEERNNADNSRPTVTVTDNGNTGRISNSDNSEKEPSFTVQRSDNGAAADSDLTSLYNESAKSCVSVICTVTVSGGFFGTSYEGQSLGSGFVIDKSGYIVTNHHVIEDAKKITVQFYDGEQVSAELIGSDETCDLAVLKISTDRELYPVTFGDSDKVQIGQKVYAIGTPSNIKLAGTLTYGVVSGVNRQVSLTNDSGSVVKTMTLIQTDATLNPGNSGGPLFNMNGEVIGINTLKLSSTYEGIGFSIPSTGAVEVINDLIQNGKVSNPGSSYVKGTAKLGIEGATVNEASIKNYNLPESVPKGVYVATVSRKSAVYKEGLSAEDIITEFNGKKVETMEELKAYLAECSAGDTATIKYYRLDRHDDSKGEYFDITFKLDAQS